MDARHAGRNAAKLLAWALEPTRLEVPDAVSKRSEGRVLPVDGREQRSIRTREKIRRAAGELIIEKGLQATTVDEIAAAAGVAKGTFYVHFDSKEDLALAYAARRLEHVESVLPEILTLDSVRQALHRIVSVVVKGKRWHPEIVKCVVLTLAAREDRLPSHDLHQLLLPLVEHGVGRGELRDDIPPATLASFVADTVYCGLRNWGMGISGGDLDHAIDTAVTLAYDALRAPHASRS